MAKLKNTQTVNSSIKQKAVQSIRTNVKPMVVRYLNDMLSTQVNAEGNRFPEKKESTKKQYRYKGWNEDQWLIRTGESTVVKARNIQSGISLRPEDPNKILQYVKQSDLWFTLNETIRLQIVEQIKKDLER